MRILVTGCAGFIGFYTAKNLVNKGYEVLGLDNINEYYDVDLKYDRLEELGFSRADIAENKVLKSTKHQNLQFSKTDITDYKGLQELFNTNQYEFVIHLAAQAGVRYSLENPSTYIQSNLVGFGNILELCRHNKVKHLVYASSSSVYGNNQKVPFSEKDFVDQPVSLYAATKKSNELMAHSYAHLYKFQATGLRFFTVYGPWGRPDMAPMLFANAITKNEEIKVFNNGQMQRDFTYIDDIVEGIVKSLEYKNPKGTPHEVFNIGNSSPVALMEFIELMEKEFQTSAKKKMMPMQPGDVKQTYADTSLLAKATGYAPKTELAEGLHHFVKWYKAYFKISKNK